MERITFCARVLRISAIRLCRSLDSCPIKAPDWSGSMLQSTTFLSFGTVAQWSQLTIKRAMTPLNH